MHWDTSQSTKEHRSLHYRKLDLVSFSSFIPNASNYKKYKNYKKYINVNSINSRPTIVYIKKHFCIALWSIKYNSSKILQVYNWMNLTYVCTRNHYQNQDRKCFHHVPTSVLILLYQPSVSLPPSLGNLWPASSYCRLIWTSRISYKPTHLICTFFPLLWSGSYTESLFWDSSRLLHI